MTVLKLKKGAAIIGSFLLCLSFFSTALAMQPVSEAAADPQANQTAPVSWPEAPTGFSAVVTKSSVTLQWDKVEGAQAYKVYTSSSQKGNYKLLKTVTGTTLAHTIKLGKSTRYYVVCAVSAKTNGSLSDALAVKIKTALDGEYDKIVNPSYVISGLEEKYLNAINADRKANGLAALKYRADLSETAMVKAADMMAAGYFYEDHISPTYGHPSEMGKKYLGYPIAENILDATGPWQNTYANAADLARDQFMKSEKHKATRLDKSLKYVGFAMYYDGNRLCVCEHFSIK